MRYLCLIILFIVYSKVNAMDIKEKNKVLTQIENIKLNLNIEELDQLSNLIFKFRDRNISAAAIKALHEIQLKNKNIPTLFIKKFIDPEQPSYFSLFILDIFMIKNRGVIVTGIVSSGTIRVGDVLTIKKANGTDIDAICFGIDFIESKNKQVSSGQIIGVALKDISINDLEQGDMLYHKN